MDQINEKLCQAESDRDVFKQEASLAEAKLHDYNFDVEEEEQKRKLLEAECAEMHQKVSDLLDANRSLGELTLRNANLERLQQDSSEMVSLLKSQLN